MQCAARIDYHVADAIKYQAVFKEALERGIDCGEVRRLFLRRCSAATVAVWGGGGLPEPPPPQAVIKAIARQSANPRTSLVTDVMVSAFPTASGASSPIPLLITIRSALAPQHMLHN